MAQDCSHTSETDELAAVPLATVLPEEDKAISLLDILLILSQRKQIVLLVTVAAAVVAVIVSLLLPARFTATCTILPPQQNSSLNSILSTQLGGMAAIAGSTIGIKNPNDMYISMLRSRTVEEAMVQHFGLMQEYHKKYLSDACKYFEKSTEITGNGKDGLIHIAVRDRDPQKAAALANGYIEQFRTLSEHLAVTEAAQRRLFFQQQLEDTQNKLAQADEALKNTQQKTGVIEINSQARGLIESAVALRAKVAAQEVILRSMQTYATNQNADVIRAQQELAGLRAQLAQLGGADSASNDIIVPKGKVPQAGLEYARKLREVKYEETLFEILARQFEMAKLDEAKEGALIQVVDPAGVPDRRSSPRRAVIVIGSTLLGFFLGIAIAFADFTWKDLQTDPKVKNKLSLFMTNMGLRRV